MSGRYGSSFGERIGGGQGSLMRPMARRDLDEVLRLIRLHDSDDYRAAREGFERADFDADPRWAAHVVLEDPDERRVVGVSGYYNEDLEVDDVFWLSWTYVNPYFRGKGYGKLLLRWVIDTLPGYGGRKLYLSTSSLPKYEGAIRFYESFGFRIEGLLRDYFQPGEDKLIFGVDL